VLLAFFLIFFSPFFSSILFSFYQGKFKILDYQIQLQLPS